jgi:hypothetical protein
VVPWSIVTAGNGEWMTRGVAGGGGMAERTEREKVAA